MGQEARREKALAALQEATSRLGSSALAQLTAHVSKDPFAKIKNLIQGLVERLMSEATAEAGKKGFCDKKVATTRQERNTRMEEVHKIVTQIITLASKEDELKLEIQEMTDGVKKLGDDLESASGLRSTEHSANLETIRKAKQGAKAVGNAIDTLTVFYNKAAQAEFVQTSQTSPVDSDTDGAGFEGNYKGKQAASTGIIGILEVVKADFERTIKLTNGEEEGALAKFVDFERASKSDIADKKTTKERDEEDLDTTTKTKKSKMTDMQSTMDMVDSAIKQLESLRPMCIDSGMSRDDRASKRDEEITALKKALCELDEDNVESDCPLTPASPVASSSSKM